MNETLVRLFLFYDKEQQIRKQLQAYLQYSENSDAILGSCNVLWGWGSGEDAQATLVNLV